MCGPVRVTHAGVAGCLCGGTQRPAWVHGACACAWHVGAWVWPLGSAATSQRAGAHDGSAMGAGAVSVRHGCRYRAAARAVPNSGPQQQPCWQCTDGCCVLASGHMPCNARAAGAGGGRPGRVPGCRLPLWLYKGVPAGTVRCINEQAPLGRCPPKYVYRVAWQAHMHASLYAPYMPMTRLSTLLFCNTHMYLPNATCTHPHTRTGCHCCALRSLPAPCPSAVTRKRTCLQRQLALYPCNATVRVPADWTA